jgi:SAM-dependent methyltransferase
MPPLYDKEAQYYDLLYHDLDYPGSAAQLRDLLRGQLGVSDGATLLEAACGTAKFLNPLAAWYQVAGFDNSAEQIAVARTNFPHLNLWVDNMADFIVEKPYDVLCCLFSSIGYLVPEENLARGFKAFRGALKPGGSLVIQPWFKPAAYQDGMPGLTTYDGDHIKISRQAVSRIEGGHAVLNFHFLVTVEGQEPVYFTNRHVLGLYSPETTLRLLDEAGFDMNYTEEGPLASRGLYFGKRR